MSESSQDGENWSVNECKYFNMVDMRFFPPHPLVEVFVLIGFFLGTMFLPVIILHM